jgi:hypothetical protein
MKVEAMLAQVFNAISQALRLHVTTATTAFNHIQKVNAGPLAVNPQDQEQT